MYLCFGCGGEGGVVGEWVVGLGQGLGGWCHVMSVCVVGLDSLCRWQVQIPVYCARRIPAHLWCTQRSIMLHLIDICFLTCICLRQILQIQTCLRVVVEPGLVSTSPDFMRSIASYPAGPHGWLAQKTVIGPHCWWWEGSTQFAQGLPDRCDSSTACRLCRLFSFRIMPFELFNAPAIFSRSISLVLKGLSWRSVIAFLDGVGVLGRDF